MKFEEKYTNEACKLLHPPNIGGSAGWRSPSNIALVKYWGKRYNQLPRNPSLSFCLENSFTETKVEFEHKGIRRNKEIQFEFKFEKKPKPEFEEGIKAFLYRSSVFLPFLKDFYLNINSSNSFPHSSGIASSASSYSALALCLVSMEQSLFGTPADEQSFLRKASFLARHGSGSASRSVYGDFVIWGKHKGIRQSSDELAIKLDLPVHKKLKKLRDAILITSRQRKKVSSSAGHQLMNDHPYASRRFDQAKHNLDRLIEAIKSGDDETFVQVIENEALSLHAMMMTSKEGFTLLTENTWNIINCIRQFRSDTKIFITFSLDAGPNLHLIYRDHDKSKIMNFVRNSLLGFCENGEWINDRAGKGPIRI